MVLRWHHSLLALPIAACASGAAVVQSHEDVLDDARGLFRAQHRAQLEAAADACRERGGDFEYRGLAFAPICTLRLSDGGTECRSNSDCEGECIVDLERPRVAHTPIPEGTAVVGQCTAVSPHLGCYVPVHEGRAMQAICVD